MPLTIEQQKALAIAQAKRKRAEAGGDAKPDPNASNPIITAQRQSQVKAGNDFVKKKDAERRYQDELAVMNASSPIPFKNTGPDGPLELNQERPDLFAGRATGAFVNSNIGVANLGGQVGLSTANAYGAGFDPSMQGALAGGEYGDITQRVADAAQQGGYVQNQQAVGDIIPSLPIPAATTPGEMGADVIGNLASVFTGFGAPILKGGKALSESLATVPGMSRTLRGVGVETGENAALAYGLSAGAAPADSDRNMAGTRGAADPLNYVSIEAARAIPRGIKALEAPNTPTNAGGANLRQPAPQTPPVAPVAAATQTAQQAPQPSVAPVVPQAAPRAAQAGPAGAGQQPPVSPPTLNAVPTTPAVPKQQMLVARDTAKILTRIMRAANVKNADIRGYLPGAVQRYKSLNDSRVPFAFFLEGDLPKHFAEPVAADVVTKLQGWGRARNAAMGTGDKSAQITQGTIKELRGSQQDFLTKSAEANLYKGSLISQEDQILKSLRETGRKGYEPSLDYARQAIDGRRKPSAAEAQAVDDLRQILARPTLQKYVDDATRIRAEKDGIDIDQMIKDDPIGSAHWLQSEFRRLSDASEDALTGKPTRTSGAYDDLREMILDPLKRASPGYEGAMMRFGHDFGSKEAVTFGKGIFTASRGAYDTAQKIRKFKKLGRRQQTVAWKSIRDEFLNEFRGTPEDAAAKLTRMQQEGALDLLEQMGARGKRFADDIRRIAQQENPSIRAIEQASNSLTFKNLSGAEAAREMVQSPINQVVGSVTDKASWPMTLAADAMVMGTTGIPAPMLTASKLMDKFGNPGPQTLSRATEGLYGLPSKASGSTPELLKASRGGGGGRPKGSAPQVEQDIGALLKALDEVEADPKRRGGPEGKRLLNQIAAAQGGKPSKPKRQKVAAAPATGLGGPASPASASPDATGLGASAAKPPEKAGLRGNPEAIGAGIGTVFAPDADGDGEVSFGERAGAAISGGVAGRLLRGGKAPPASAGKFRGPNNQTFAGVNAKTADKAALARAQNMEAEGASREEIIDATGWFKQHGQWKFEIIDSGAKLTGNKSGPLGSVMEHPELYKAYPDLAELNTTRTPWKTGGDYIAPSVFNDEMIRVGNVGDDARSIALHEAGGHGVQRRENFPSGASSKLSVAEHRQALSDDLEDTKYWLERHRSEGATASEIRAAEDRVAQLEAQFDATRNLTPTQFYRNTAGEVEARNVQKRDEIRRRGKNPGRPWETQDVPDDQQIVRFGSGKAESRPPTKGQKAAPKKAEEVALINALKKARATETATRRRNVMRDNRDELNRPAEEAVMQAERDLLEYRDRQFRQAATGARWLDRGSAIGSVGKKAAVATGNQIKKTMMKNDAELLKTYAFAAAGIGATALGMRALAGPDDGKDEKKEAIAPTDKRYFVETKLKKRPEMLGPVQQALVEIGMLDANDADTKWGTKTRDAIEAYLSQKPDRLPIPLQDYEVPALLAEAYGGYQEDGKWFYDTGEPIVYPPKRNDTYLPARPLRPDEARRMQYEKRTEAQRKQ